MENAYLIIVIGVLLLFFLGMNAIFTRIKLPSLIAFILFGWLVRTLGEYLNLLTPELTFTLGLLAKIGIILLLFHVGIETNLKKLLDVIVKAGFVSFFEILVSGLFVFIAAYAFGLNLREALIIGIAMVATSIGVSIYSWEEKDRSERKEASFLLDLASFDDIIGILLFSVLLVFLGSSEHTGALFTKDLLLFFLKFFLLIAGCYLFSHFIEKKIMTDLIRYEKMPDSMLSIAGIGLLIAGISAFLGFSLVIGGFFAGIAFSRDPRSVRMDASMQSLLDFFAPFFFFWIGYQITIEMAWESWHFFLLLLLAAIAGKLIGVWVPSRIVKIAPLGALLLAVSMVPRAEVAMVIFGHSLEQNWITERVYSAGALVVLATCLVGAFFTKIILKAPQR